MFGYIWEKDGFDFNKLMLSCTSSPGVMSKNQLGKLKVTYSTALRIRRVVRIHDRFVSKTTPKIGPEF